MLEKLGTEVFASVSSSSSKETSSVGVSPHLSVPPPPSQMIASLLDRSWSWALSAIFLGGNKLKGE
ncbi:hypothetical protein BVC80_8337g5 [Macleaya cordata]|uniref:Uncharacterized protein n=1 Tax=Macleaya cordata TaxID=56857 RepID=A0A200R8J4_MACCD|nr:hypothetical protein BVC80_8337g5 [Macleaya cordata]